MTFNLVVFFFRHHSSLILLVLHQLSMVFSTSRAEKIDGLLNFSKWWTWDQSYRNGWVSLAGPYLNFPSWKLHMRSIFEQTTKGPRVLRVFFLAMTSNMYARKIRKKNEKNKTGVASENHIHYHGFKIVPKIWICVRWVFTCFHGKSPCFTVWVKSFGSLFLSHQTRKSKKGPGKPWISNPRSTFLLVHIFLV